MDINLILFQLCEILDPEAALSVIRRTSTTSQNNSHGNYVDIETIDSILYQTDVNSENLVRKMSDNHLHSLLENNSSPIYENQSSVRRSESPIYSNTHNQSISSFYPKGQNLYSNIPSATSTAAYLNLPQTQPLYSNVGLMGNGSECAGMSFGEQLMHNARHHGILPQSKMKY